MKLRISFGRFDVVFVAASFVLCFAAASQSSYAGQQQEQQTSQAQQRASQPQQNPQSSPQPQDPSRPKPRKIWTNDDVISLRSPADIYQVEKEAQEAADVEEAAQKADLEKQVKQAGLTIKLPPTSDETQRSIQEKEERIKDLQERLDRLNHALPDAPEPQKTTTQKLIETFTGDLHKAQLELKVLQNHLKTLTKTPPGESPPSPTTPPSPENPN
jgi:hypothetical protein